MSQMYAFMKEEEPKKKKLDGDGPAPPDYFLALMRALYCANKELVHKCEHKGDNEMGMYYRGRVDAIEEALQHYEELKR